MMSRKDPLYLAEKQRRMKIRKDKRNTKYREASMKASELGRPISAVNGGSWFDENSPTGMSQICDYYGTCQSPCNGDC